MRWLRGRTRWKLAVLAAVGLAAVGGAAFWGYTVTNEAGAQGTRYRWVNVSIELPPQETGGIVVSRHDGLPDTCSPSPGTRVPGLRVFKTVVEGTSVEVSNLYIDATTGDVLCQDVRPEDEAAFDAVLATLRLEGPDLPDVWPYSGSPPEERRRQEGSITFVEPVPASGIRIGGGISDGFEGSMTFLTMSNGRSFREVNADTGEIVMGDNGPVDYVDPVDREAFDRLTSTIQLIPSGGSR